MDQRKSEQAALRERVKELTCLYNLSQIAQRPGITFDEILQAIAELLPAAWQYPEIAAGQIVIDGHSYVTKGFEKGLEKQSADIALDGKLRGCVQVVYTEKRPPFDEGPFLKEERSLLEAIADQISLLIQRRQANEDKARLQNQLHHADRLATIGQLAAGIAHELNEPLGNILGFAQLAQKQPGLPEESARDVEKIVATSLHARQIINNLMLFSRQMPPQKTLVNLNTIVEESLGFLETRCVKNGIAVLRDLAAEMSEITADASQIRQVFVNLVVNAIHAMPSGGTLTITTQESDNHVLLRVEDDGLGMSEQVLKEIFVPFFTTKDIHEGTGLGLPVVHGIVTAHGGKIRVGSAPQRGTQFDIELPVALKLKKREDANHGTCR